MLCVFKQTLGLLRVSVLISELSQKSPREKKIKERKKECCWWNPCGFLGLNLKHIWGLDVISSLTETIFVVNRPKTLFLRLFYVDQNLIVLRAYLGRWVRLLDKATWIKGKERRKVILKKWCFHMVTPLLNFEVKIMMIQKFFPAGTITVRVSTRLIFHALCITHFP